MMLVLPAAGGAVAESAEKSAVWQKEMPVAFQDAAVGDRPVLLLLETEENVEPGLSEQIAEAAGALDGPPVLARLMYPDQPYVRSAAAHEFIQWADLGGVQQLPAVVWFSPDGRPCLALPFDEGDLPKRFVGAIGELDARYQRIAASFKSAESAAGLDRAQKLHQGLQEISPSCLDAYHDQMEQIVTLDADNQANLREQYAPILADAQINEVIQDQVYPLIDATAYREARVVLKNLEDQTAVSVEQRQLLVAFGAQLYFTEGDLVRAETELDRAIAMAKDSEVSTSLRETKAKLFAPTSF